ncbi:MAG TPA: hypothetical protein VKR43_18595 [Bryobacteraceae bacterium]|nr:hypothetical protein [Bryobacteraceae bacterium]
MPDELRVDYSGPAPELLRVFMELLAIVVVIGLADVLRQAAVYQLIGAAPQFFSPRPVLGLRAENIFQPAS